jgi:predicted naringenin-chalcone synthase
MEASILAISTAVPSYAFAQEEVADKLIDILSIDPEKAKTVRKLYQNSAIRTRYSVIPDFHKERDQWHFWGSEFPKTVPGMAQRNDRYKAPKLAHQAAVKAVDSWGGDPETITHLISVSCTGVVAPGIEFDLMRRLKLKFSTQRLGINFMGCFGAFKGLAVAQSFAKEDPKHRILLVCTELCSLHFQVDQTPDNMLANSIFSDGAAAVIVGADPKSHENSIWEIRHKWSLGLDNTWDKMGWEAGDTGFLMKLSHTVPVVLGRQMTSFLHSLIDCSYADCDWAIHPGGKSIIQSLEKALQIDGGLTKASWDILANYGNMSSATFLFVLNRLLELKSSKKLTVGIGFGPGLSVEGILLSK